MIQEQIARVCHEVNRAYCEATGDMSQPIWENAPDWQKNSALHGVQAIQSGEVTHPEQSHNNWSKEKIEAGWVYGPVKDADKKTHPCLVPYDELPDSQIVKDYLFFAVVRSLS